MTHHMEHMTTGTHTGGTGCVCSNVGAHSCLVFAVPSVSLLQTAVSARLAVYTNAHTAVTEKGSRSSLAFHVGRDLLCKKSFSSQLLAR